MNDRATIHYIAELGGVCSCFMPVVTRQGLTDEVSLPVEFRFPSRMFRNKNMDDAAVLVKGVLATAAVRLASYLGALEDQE